jgi:aconitate hydratase
MYTTTLTYQNSTYNLVDLASFARQIELNLNDLPFSMRILLENTLRFYNESASYQAIVDKYLNKSQVEKDLDFFPARVLMQDFTGVPAVVDLANMRDEITATGRNASDMNPKIPVDLIIDHSLQVDKYATSYAFQENMQLEFARNKERYEFLKWAQSSFKQFRVVPPGAGICHQVNLEYLAEVVFEKDSWLYPDTLVGTDSHTTMINALGVLGWGVGGIEAEAALLGEPLSMLIPKVVGVQIIGRLPQGVFATDLVIYITNKLRKHGVVGKFVEFYGEGLSQLTLADRATISNMAPEYGATCGFFPLDQEAIKYLILTGRNEDKINLCEIYAKKQGLWYNPKEPITIKYDEEIVINLSEIKTFVAGPKRPQDLITLSKIADNFNQEFEEQSSYNQSELENGSVVIAAITSCTNTSNPTAMIAAGLFAKKAVEAGLKVKNYVKTSFAPGSQVVTNYLKASGLQKYLDELGFNLVGYGCTTCIGNSGPLESQIENTIKDKELIVASLLSGNRNFEGRIHPLVKANYLAAPFLVVAYALAGNIKMDLTKEPLGYYNSQAFYLKDFIPQQSEIDEIIASFVTKEEFSKTYSRIFLGNEEWQKLQTTSSDLYPWNIKSTYIKKPPYFDHITSRMAPLEKASILAIFGDSITTDHISPAGNIANNSPAAKYLTDHQVTQENFNSYGARRGNHEVMMRGTFANIRIKNKMVPGVEGGFTKYQGNLMSIYDAAMAYQKSNKPLVIIAGKEYGTGSSRDWAAKGTALLGVKAVIAESFERIHRSNLVGMGVIPLKFLTSIADINLSGDEKVTILNLNDTTQPLEKMIIQIGNKDLEVQLEVYTERELNYLKAGGIMPFVLSNQIIVL